MSGGLLTAARQLAGRVKAKLVGRRPDDRFDLAAANRLLAAHGLPPVTADCLNEPGDPVQRIYEFRPDMRTVFPFGMTPQQREAYLGWLLTHGAAEMGITPEQAVRFLVRTDRLPDRGLVQTYLLSTDWQARVPHGLTVFGWPELIAFLKAERGLRGSWADRLPPPRVYRPWDELTLLRRARPDLAATFPADPFAALDWIDRQPDLPKPDAAWRAELARDLRAGIPSRRGVNVFAHLRFPCGLQQAALAAIAGLNRVGVRTTARDMLPEFPGDLADPARYDGVELFDTTLAVCGLATPPFRYLERSGAHLRDGVYRAAILYWESDEPPDDLAERVRPFDEVWAPTRFLADAYRKKLTIPVVPMLPGHELPPFDRLPRSHFGLRDGRFVVLFAFDMPSVMARKNPLGLIAAFRRAFRPDEPADLVIKVSRGSAVPADLAALTAACEANGVALIDRLMPRAELLALMACCDCYASLHRAEGLGLGMAEAMLLGKPVVATAYSGNMDFITPQAGYLVDFTREPVAEDVPPYPRGSGWAEPSVEHAAGLLRQVYDHPDEARAVGERAREVIAESMSLEAAGRRMAERLAAIDQIRAAGPANQVVRRTA